MSAHAGSSDRRWVLKQYEDEAHRLLDSLPQWKQAVIYKQLFALGHRIGTVDTAIHEGIKKETK